MKKRSEFFTIPKNIFLATDHPPDLETRLLFCQKLKKIVFTGLVVVVLIGWYSTCGTYIIPRTIFLRFRYFKTTKPQPNPTQPNPTQPNPTQPNPTQPNHRGGLRGWKFLPRPKAPHKESMAPRRCRNVSPPWSRIVSEWRTLLVD